MYPAGHNEGTVTPNDGQTWPRGHNSQNDCPTRFWKYPGVQRVKFERPLPGHMAPAGHVRVSPDGQKLPAGHTAKWKRSLLEEKSTPLLLTSTTTDPGAETGDEHTKLSGDRNIALTILLPNLQTAEVSFKNPNPVIKTAVSPETDALNGDMLTTVTGSTNRKKAPPTSEKSIEFVENPTAKTPVAPAGVVHNATDSDWYDASTATLPKEHFML